MTYRSDDNILIIGLVSISLYQQLVCQIKTVVLALILLVMMMMRVEMMMRRVEMMMIKSVVGHTLESSDHT